MDPAPEQPADIEQKVAEAAKVQTLEEQIVAALKTCYDPEIPVDIYELGLIYGIEVDPAGVVVVRMTLTSPMCPAAESLPPEVQHKIEAIPGVTSAKIDIVWEPVWTMDRMSEAARLKLGLDY
ncbi:MAG TPA: iron-sulfur cluster assembly protein [Gemmataceae bacterium]|nr:iron-sulfur cluster assembly protein [Gemmataceae bacterium]